MNFEKSIHFLKIQPKVCFRMCLIYNLKQEYQHYFNKFCLRPLTVFSILSSVPFYSSNYSPQIPVFLVILWSLQKKANNTNNTSNDSKIIIEIEGLADVQVVIAFDHGLFI